MNTPDNKMTFEYVDRHRKVKDTVYQEMKEHFTDTVFELSKQRNPDCILIAEGKSLKAHKFLLAAASPLLKVIIKLLVLVALIKYFEIIPGRFLNRAKYWLHNGCRS